MLARVGNIPDARIALAPLEARHRPYHAIAIEQYRRSIRLLLDPADAGFVARVNEEIPQAGVGRGASPIGAADRAWKNNGRIRLRARCAIDVGRERSVVVKSSAPGLQVETKFRVFRVGVLGGHYVFRSVTHA